MVSRKYMKGILPALKWGYDPEVEMAPRPITPGERLHSDREIYYLVVDVRNGEPALLLYHRHGGTAECIGEITDIPYDLLREAVSRPRRGAMNISGWYPATRAIEAWVREWASEGD